MKRSATPDFVFAIAALIVLGMNATEAYAGRFVRCSKSHCRPAITGHRPAATCQAAALPTVASPIVVGSSSASAAACGCSR